MSNKSWVAAVIAASVTVAAAIGFNFPGHRMGNLETEVVKLRDHINAHEVEFGKVNLKLDYLTDGMNELLSRKKK